MAGTSKRSTLSSDTVISLTLPFFPIFDIVKIDRDIHFVAMHITGKVVHNIDTMVGPVEKFKRTKEYNKGEIIYFFNSLI